MTSIGQDPDQLDAAVRVPAHDRRVAHDRGHDRRRGLARGTSSRGSDVAMFRSAIRLALPVVFVATLLTTLIGHAQAQLMTKQQPMKMAAAEALYTTRSGAPFSLFAVAPFEHTPTRSTFDITIPHGLSILATQLLERQGRGHQRPRARLPGEVRPRRLRPDRRRHLLDVPDHDRHRLPARRAHGPRHAAALAGHARDLAALPARSRRTRSRCRSSRTRAAGSSPRWAASRGSCRGS